MHQFFHKLQSQSHLKHPFPEVFSRISIKFRNACFFEISNLNLLMMIVHKSTKNVPGWLVSHSQKVFTAERNDWISNYFTGLGILLERKIESHQNKKKHRDSKKKLYRDCLRVSRHIGVVQGKIVQQNLVKHVRNEFKKHKYETNPEKIEKLRES